MSTIAKPSVVLLSSLLLTVIMASVVAATKQPVWSIAQEVSTGRQPKIVWNATGPYIFFIDNHEYPYQDRLYYRGVEDNGSLGDKTAIPLTTYAYDAETDPNGGLHVWGADGLYSYKASGGVWSAPVATGIVGSGYAWYLQISPVGRAYVMTAYGRVAEQQADGTWLRLPDPFAGANGCQYAFDAASTLHTACEVQGSIYSKVVYSSRPLGGSWSEPFSLSDTELAVLEPLLAVDNLGRVHIVYREQVGLATFQRFHRYLANGVWSAPSMLPDTAWQLLLVLHDGSLGLVGQTLYSWTEDAGWHTGATYPPPIGNNGRPMNGPRAFLSDDGSLHYLWVDCSNGGCFSTSYDKHGHTWRTSQGSWLGATGIDIASQQWGGGSSATGGAGNSLHVAWHSDGKIWYSSFEEKNDNRIFLPAVRN